MRRAGFAISKRTVLRVRLVRVQLPTSVEVLITNLWEEEGHSADIFKDLYFMRWGVETGISLQKNILQMESFSGLTVHAVMQDFYATVMTANLHAILIKDAQQTVADITSHHKYPMKVNKNKSFGKLKANITSIFLQNDVITILRKLHDYFIKEIIPVRKGRSFERVKKNIHAKSKHKTYSNFKPTY